MSANMTDPRCKRHPREASVSTPLRLVSPSGIHNRTINDVVTHLEDMIAMAKNGEITGVAAVAWGGKGKHPIFGASGCLRDNPRDGYWAVGLLQDVIMRESE